MNAHPLAAVFDAALRQVDRALATGLTAADGRPAAERLTTLRASLAAEREAAVARGAVDAAWVRETVRDVAAWTPEGELALLAALGAIARARAAPGRA